MKKLLLSAAATLLALGASAQTIEDVRIYINPGHGAFDANSRPMGTVKHGENNAYSDVNNDTTNFFESNTNLQKGLAMLEKLVEYGVPFDRTKNQENENPHRIGAALDLSQNIVMSRVKSGVAPAYVDYTTHETPAETDYYDRSLAEVAAEVEFNNFDMFISIHSNANNDGDNVNFPVILYRGTDAQEGNAGSIDMGKAVWPHLYGLGHQQWSAYSVDKTNIRGDHTFYGSTSTVKYEITDNSYIYDTTDQFSQLIEATDTTPTYVAYTGYLGVIKHGVPGFLSEGYFHTYQPARHRYMNWGVCHLEGEAYAKGLNDYYGWGKTESTGTIYGVVRDKYNKFSHKFYTPNVSSNDKFQPLNEAVVTLKKGEEVVATYTTDDEYNGVFIFNDVEPGTYSLNYSHPAYKAAEEEYTAEFEVTAGGMYYPEAFLVDTAWVAPTIVYENYPDSTAGKEGFNVFPNYEVKAKEYAPLATLLEGKTVRRQIVRDDKLYVLALDEANEPYIYLADLANDTVMTLDTKPVVMGANGRLKISDIALTADHVLIAGGLSKTQFSESYIEEGETRGSVNYYKWSQDSITGLPDTCELWFTTDHACKFFRGLLGRTIAYSGTLEDGTITATCPHGTLTSDIGMRFAQFAIVEGQNTGVVSYDAWIAPPNETNFYSDALSDCDDYEMMISPLGENNFVLDGNLIAPFEWTSESEGSEPQVLGRNENVSNVKATGANYFRYAGKYFMVTPKVNDEGKVAGIELFDISEGFSAAKAVELIGGDIEPVDYKYASAHGELALTLTAEDITTDADLELFLVVDGKTYKFTETETYTSYEPQEGGTANPFAYALKSELNDKTITINYSLNADAEDVKILVKNAEGEVALTLEQGAQTKGAQTAEINVDESFTEDGTYTWEVVVDGADKTAVETFANYMFYHPRGVDVDNNMESPSFGNIYCTEGMTSASSDYHSNTTTSGGLGLYAFTADMQPILNPATGKYGFNGGWALSYKIGSSNAADLARVRVAEDGRIFVTRMSGQGNYIMYAPSFEDLVANNKFTSLFEGLTLDAATYNYSDANGNFMGAANLGFDVKGSGEDLKMVALSSNANHWSYVYSGASTDEYALGTAATLPVPTNIAALTGKYTIAPAATNVTYDDNKGGIWYCQYRGTPSDAQPGLVYIDSTGVEKYKDLVSRGGGGVRVSPDGTQIAVASSSANPKHFTVYNLVWSEDGVPALRREYVITHNIGTNVYDIAWDLAGNIYICGNSGEYLKGFALPRTEAFTTKAATQYALNIEETSGINKVSIDNDSNAPVEYYNLQGVKVANPSNGVFIKVQGKKASKVFVK